MQGSARKRAAVNAAATLVGRGVSFLIGIMLVPFIIHRLGKDDFGVFQLVRSITGYLPVVAIALGPAVSRYVTAALARDDRLAVNRYMSTAFAGFVVISGICIFAGAIAAWILPDLTDLGDQARGSQWLLLLLVVSFALTQISALFSAPFAAREMLAETTALWTLSDALRAGCIVAAFSLFKPSLPWIGLATVVGVGVTCLIRAIGSYVVLPWLHISWQHFDWSSIRELVSFSIFSTIGALISAIYFGTDFILIKWLFGTGATTLITVYSLGAMWDGWLRTGLSPIIRVILPRMTMMAEREQLADLRRVTLIAIRYSLGVTAPICVFLCILAEPLLRIWLGSALTAGEFATAARIIPIFLVPLIFALGMAPAQSVFVAKAKVAVPTTVGLIFAILNLVLSVVFARYAHWGLYGIAAGTGIAVTLNSVIFQPFYLRRLIQTPYTQLCSTALLWPAVLTAAFAIVCWFLNQALAPASISGIAGTLAIVGVPYGIALWFLILEPRDRQGIQNRLLRRNR